MTWADQEAKIAELLLYVAEQTEPDPTAGATKPVLVVQKRLGHARLSITLDVYGSLFHGADEAGAESITEGLSQ